MPNVSVIVPCLNEEATICQLLQAILTQTYPLSDIEVIVADGLSTDHTRQKIMDFQLAHPELEISLIDNPRHVIPSGLNRAIERASGKYILRMDAHSIPLPDYIQKCVNGLSAGFGDNVGGVWLIQPGASTWMARSIAIAVSHPVGAGDARYRIGGRAGEVDTVPFGAYRREMLDKVGLFDENLLSNEDYELNVRLRQAGGKVWMDPGIHSIYFARSTLKDLSKQYWRYGYWKAQMLRKYPNTIRLRQLVPPLFVLGLLCLAILSLLFSPVRWMLAIIVLLYIVAIFSIGILMTGKYKSSFIAVGVPLAFATIHFSWGFAVLWGSIFRPRSGGVQR